MFARYEYKAGSAPTEIINDLILLLTGTTDVNALSASCVKETSYINSDVARPAGWELWDAAPNATGKCVRALNADGSTYKYVLIDRHATSGVIYFKTYESWNATTHVGTNLCSGSDNAAMTYRPVDGGIIFISASARSLFAQTWSIGTWDSGPFFVCEHTRDEPWDTVEHGSTCFGYGNYNIFSSSAGYNSNSGYEFTKPRIKYPVTGDVVNGNASSPLMGPYSNNYGNINLYNSSPGERIRDAAGNGVHAFCNIMVVNSKAIFGKLYDVYLTTRGAGLPSDEAVYDGKTYFIMGNPTGGVRIAVPKF